MAGDHAGAGGDHARDVGVKHGARSVGPHLGAGPRPLAEFIVIVFKWGSTHLFRRGWYPRAAFIWHPPLKIVCLPVKMPHIHNILNGGVIMILTL